MYGTPTKTGINGQYYALELYLSADDIPVRNHIVGVTFGADQMGKNQIDTEIDRWIEQTVNNDTFPKLLEGYTRKEGMWENSLNSEEDNVE